MFQSKFLNLALEYLCFKPEIDLFGTITNKQFGNLGQIQGAMDIEAFRIDWSDLKFHAFPPISLIPTVFSEVNQDRAEVIIVATFWST